MTENFPDHWVQGAIGYRAERERREGAKGKANGAGNKGSGTTYSWQDHVYTAAELQRRTFPAVSYCVPDLIPEGLTIIAGKPKIGSRGHWMSALPSRPVASAWASASRYRATSSMPLWRITHGACSGASIGCCRRSVRNGQNG